MTKRERAFFLVALKYRPRDVDGLLRFLPKTQQDKMRSLYDQLKVHDPGSVQWVAAGELRKLGGPGSRTYLSEVHTDWILELLICESPHMIATILRYLPAERIRPILERLPAETLAAMPRVADTYAIPAELVALLRQKFESQFTTDRTLAPGEELDFSHLALLRADEVKRVLLETGYREIALALKSLPDKARQIVLDRLSISDRRHVALYLKHKNDAAPQRIKRAQTHLVSPEINTRDPERFVEELGFLILAKALLPADQEALTMIKHKMSQEEARILEKIVARYIHSNTEAGVVAYREDVLMALKQILGVGSSAIHRVS